MEIAEFLITMGIPTAITGLIVWFFKRYLDKRDKEKEKREAEEKAARILKHSCS